VLRFFSSWRARVVLFLAVVGPGFITANVDNDAGGIFTYSLAGAQFGYSLLWRCARAWARSPARG